MKKGRLPNELWESFRAMSVDVGRLDSFLKDTSCMNVDERLNIAYCETLKRLIDDPELNEFLNEVAIPFFRYTGRAKWGRDVVTDLGFALAGQKSRKRDVSKILDFDPSGA